MSTILTDDEFPPLRPQDHPEPHSFAWTEQEMRAIRARDRLVEAAVLAKLREQEPVAWTLTETLSKRETTARAYLWFSDPVNSSWTPLYAAPLPAVVQVPRDLPSARDYAERGTMAVTADWMAGWDAARKYVNTAAALAPRASTMSRWTERWYGSGPDRGWSIWEMTTSTHGDRVAYVGEGEHSERLTTMIVQKHNESLAAAPEAQPSVPAPWREAVKVMREALDNLADVAGDLSPSCVADAKAKNRSLDYARAAIALADSLEGGE